MALESEYNRVRESNGPKQEMVDAEERSTCDNINVLSIVFRCCRVTILVFKYQARR
jgi:hypothetical protein